MAKRELCKYRIDADEPGMNVAGAGHIFGGESIIKPGTIVTVPDSFEPRACMTPLNAAAEAAFARKRKKVEAEWRESLAKGEDPDGNALESLADGRSLTDKEIDSFVKRVVAKVGPSKKARQSQVKKTRPKVAAGMFTVSAPAPVKPANVEDDDALAAQMLAEDNAPSGQRASDQ